MNSVAQAFRMGFMGSLVFVVVVFLLFGASSEETTSLEKGTAG